MQYYIDIGNTRIKFAQPHKDLGLTAVTHDKLAVLLAVLEQHKAQRLLITSGRSAVAQKTLKNLLSFAKQKAIQTHIVTAQPQMLAINYTDKTQFGADRFLHLLAARQRFNKHFCVISCGTAITLDFYADHHLGGMIIPGLGMSKQSLKEKTGLKNIKKPMGILGNDTASCIGSGIYFGYQNLIYGSIEKVQQSTNLSYQLVFSGGDAELLSNDDLVVDKLLFEGMQIYDHY